MNGRKLEENVPKLIQYLSIAYIAVCIWLDTFLLYACIFFTASHFPHAYGVLRSMIRDKAQ